MINVRGRTSKTKGYMTEENNLKPDGLAGTLYTPEMLVEWGYPAGFVELLTKMADDESFPEQIRCAVIQYLAFQAQSEDVKEILLDDPDFEKMVGKYYSFPSTELYLDLD